ncbi:hypothetical protein BDV93DRAFT_524944 [Ceratobasidium sp. AG-I]|nr:hypothetical protein BDV93DRAFT_524944 [Ceratobasidium sp. AG-I]
MSDRFNKWAAAVKLSLKIEPELPKDNLFRSLSHIVQSSKQFPSWLSQEESGQLSYLTHRFGDWVPRLCKDVQRLGVTIQPRLDPYDSMQSGNRACRATNDDQAGNDLQQTLDPNSGALDGIVYGNGNLASGQNGRSALVLVEDPDPDLASAMSAILGLVKQSDGLIDRLTWDANEAELRSGIDHLLTLCYDESDSMTLRLERELQLPDIKDPALNIPSTKPGTCIFLEFRSIWSYRNADATLRSHYSCLFQKTPSRTLNVVHSLVEYGSGAPGQNQAFMGLVSGLYQRRFLGIKDQFVFATMQTGLSNLQVVAAIWKDDTVRFNLSYATR